MVGLYCTCHCVGSIGAVQLSVAPDAVMLVVVNAFTFAFTQTFSVKCASNEGLAPLAQLKFCNFRKEEPVMSYENTTPVSAAAAPGHSI